MSRKVLGIALATAALLAPIPGHAEPPIALNSVTVDLPDSGRMFPGPDADAINDNCLACHSAGMVLNQPALPEAAWQAEINKMIHIYKAPVAAEDVAAILDYLTRTKGVK